MGFSVMLWGAENLVPADYWCPYGKAIFQKWSTMWLYPGSYGVCVVITGFTWLLWGKHGNLPVSVMYDPVTAM